MISKKDLQSQYAWQPLDLLRMGTDFSLVARLTDILESDFSSESTTLRINGHRVNAMRAVRTADLIKELDA